MPKTLLNHFVSSRENKGLSRENNGAFLENNGAFLENNGAFLENNGAFLENNGLFEENEPDIGVSRLSQFLLFVVPTREQQCRLLSKPQRGCNRQSKHRCRALRQQRRVLE